MNSAPPHSRRAQSRRLQLKPNDSGARGRKLDAAHLRRLAEFRFQLRRFLHVSQAAAEQKGLHNQQYQMLQCVGGTPPAERPADAKSQTTTTSQREDSIQEL